MRLFEDMSRPQRKQNPMVRTFGAGTGICRDCAHFIRKELGRTYFKCGLFGNTGGSATDWRATWPACARFKK
jgi:hypothetical protein